MKTLQSLLKTNNEFAPLALRLVLAAVLFPHGAQKMLGWFGGHGFDGTMQFFTQQLGIPAPLAFIAIATEFFAPIALALGLFSRVAAFGMGTLITVAALKVHWTHGFFMNWFGNQQGEGFEYHILVAAMSVAVVLQGAGRWAIDTAMVRWLARRSDQVDGIVRPELAAR